jgi:hypothetical protein
MIFGCNGVRYDLDSFDEDSLRGSMSVLRGEWITIKRRS